MLWPKKEVSESQEVFRVAWGPQRFYLSMGWKTLTAFALVVFIPMSGLLLLTNSALRTALEKETLKSIEANLRGAWRIFNLRGEDMRKTLMQSAALPDVRDALANRDPVQLSALINRQAALHPYANVWLVLDENQHLLARRHGPTGESAFLNNTVTRAFTLDEPVISTELLSNKLFFDENPLEYSGLDTQVMATIVVVPVRHIDRRLGALVGIILLNNDFWLPNTAHDYLSVETALFSSVMQESRIIASSSRVNNVWSLGFLAPMDLNRAIRHGDMFRGQTIINGHASLVVAEPIVNLEGMPIGSLAIGLRRDGIDTLVSENSRYIYLFIGLGIALSLLVAYLAFRDTMTPMRAIIGAMDAFARGNLSVRTDMRTKDEFEEMGRGFNRMAESVEEQHRRVESFSSFASLLISSRKPEDLLQQALNRLIVLTGAHSGAIYLADRGQEARLKPFVTYALNRAKMPLLELGQGLPGEAALQRRPIHVKNMPDASHMVINLGVGEALPNEIAFFPIIYRNELLGLLMLATLNHFRPEEISTLEYTTNQIAIVLENALTHEEVERLSVTDELTQVYNRRYLARRLEEEFAQAKRYDLPLSVLVLDLDHFKQINDRYGHQFGDEALKVVARVIRDNLREVDVVGRYGGEEFLVILPHIRHQDALAVANKIRTSVEKIKLDEAPQLTLTLSIGVATFPEQFAETVNGLIAQADSALYRAKAQGRNRVIGPRV